MNDPITTLVTCGNPDCRTEINEPPSLPETDRKPCSKCGTKKRAFGFIASSSIRIEDDVSGKITHVGSNAKSTFKAGRDWNHDRAEFVTRTQFVDKKNKWYSKKVVADDGTVIRDVSHPLSEHTGHGDARKKKTGSSD